MSRLRSSPSALLSPWRVRGVLFAWLLALAVGMLAPWAQARGLEPVCSGAGPTRWMLGPEADGLAHAMHGLDCPLCMPQLAAPPTVQTLAWPGLPRAVQLPRLPDVAWTPMPSACPPPARGPPS